jgi:HAD superfamily hydrolase (TIGR01549 family)
VFSGLPASAVVDQLCVVLADGGYGDPPPDIEKSSDPFGVLKYAATLGKTESQYLNAAFTALEVEAMATAEPTAGAHDVMHAWSETDRPLAIVSNNSTLAIESFIDLHNLRPYVAHVSGREHGDPEVLKPNPYLLNQSLSALRTAAETTVFVGDSVTDILAAKTIGSMSIGYANRPGKDRQLAHFGATIVIDFMAAISDAIRC